MLNTFTAQMQLQAAQQSQLQQDVLSVTYSTTDAACLAEAFRLLTTALKGPGSHEWLRAMLQNPRSFLQHLVWIADNTLNATLLERQDFRHICRAWLEPPLALQMFFNADRVMCEGMSCAVLLRCAVS